MTSQYVTSVNGRTKVVIDGVTYKFKIGGNVHADQNSVAINGITLIKDGSLTEEGQRYLK